MKTEAHINKLFAYEHLPENLQQVSKPYHQMAMHLFTLLPESAERTLALRDLWASKNLAVWCAAQEVS